jgi:hypothetical protein
MARLNVNNTSTKIFQFLQLPLGLHNKMQSWMQAAGFVGYKSVIIVLYELFL